MRPILILALLLISLLPACGKTVQTAHIKESIEIRRVAVIPFYNVSGRRDAGRIVTEIFVTELFRDGRFQVEEPGNVLQFMFDEWMDRVGEIDREKAVVLGRRLGVDAVITGTVEEFEDGIGPHAVPLVAITARMVATEDGRVLWYGHNRKRGDDYIVVFDFGRVRSVITLAQRVVREMLEGMEF